MLDPCGRKIPWKREWQPTPVFLAGESHGQRSLAGYNPWGRKRVGHKLATKQGQPQANKQSCLRVTSLPLTQLHGLGLSSFRLKMK